MISTATLNAWAEAWATRVWASLFDATVALALVTLVWLVLRRRASAQLGYGLFLLVVLKLLVPLPVSVPAWAAWFSPRHAVDHLVQQTAATSAVPVSAETRSPFEDLLDPAGAGINARRPQPRSSAVHLPPEESSPRLSLLAYLMIGHGAVVLGLLAVFAAVQWQLHRLLRGATPIDPATFPLDLEQLRAQAGVRQKVQWLTSDRLAAPAHAGLIRPRILVPAGLAQTLSPPQLRWVLLHELAHIRRRDLWVATIQRLVQIVYFFNPAVWLANWIVNRQREWACDDMALTVSQASRRDCGAAFLSIVEHACTRRLPFAAALGFFSSKSFLRSRLMRILDNKRSLQPRLTLGSAAVLVLVAFVVLPQVRPVEAAPDANTVNGAGMQDVRSRSQPELDRPEAAAVRPIGPALPKNTPAAGTGQAADDEDEVVAKLKDLGTDIKLDANGKVEFVASDTFTDNNLALVKKLAHLKRLHVFSPQITDIGLEHLKGLTKLEELRVHNAQISDAGLEQLKGLTNLKRMQLGGNTRITGAGLEHLKGLTNLELLGLGRTNVDSDGLKHLKGLTKLTLLPLANTKVDDAGLEHLKGLTELQWLELLGTQVTDAGLKHLKELKKLTQLGLSGTQVSDAALKALKEFPNLKEVSLENTQITDKGVEQELKSMTHLTGLGLGGSKITDASLPHLKEFTNLTRLRLRGNQVTDAGLAHLKGVIGGLTDLRLDGSGITDAGLVQVKEAAKLESLVLGRTKVTDAGLKQLKELRKLQALWLDNTAITDAGLEHLKGLSNLKRLDLQNTKVTDDGVNKLKEALPNVQIMR
jgi:beta-lactamase regulating signal transducer with metallopeptidase domain/Leucine-rich repeat (LRR) protein